MIYRSTLVVIVFTSLTINFINDENTGHRHFCVTRAEFTLNSNERRFLI